MIMPTYKMVFIGDKKVGKSSLFKYFLKEKLSKVYEETKNIQKTKKVQIENLKGMKFKLYDTPGKSKTMEFASDCFLNQDCFLLMYDMTNKQSFESIKKIWLPYANEIYKVKHQILQNGNAPVIIIGNKSDSDPKDIVVNTKEVQAFAKKKEIPFIEISVIKLINVGKLTSLISELLEKTQDNYYSYYC